MGIGGEKFVGVGADLSGVDLRGAYLNGANLLEADLSNADLRGADLSNANLVGAKLNGAKLNGAKLNGANLLEADLSNADLRGAYLCNVIALASANLNGTQLLMRCKWEVIWTTSGVVRIGCESKSIEDWDAWFAGSDVYETPRDTAEFARIEAAYQHAKRMYEIWQEDQKQ